MAQTKPFAKYEVVEMRKEGRTKEGHKWYLRVFEVPAARLPSILPSKGDSLPGETAPGNTVLGPYIRDIRFGRKLKAKNGQASMQEVVIEGRLLVARS
jgi:hypothetical protein